MLLRKEAHYLLFNNKKKKNTYLIKKKKSDQFLPHKTNWKIFSSKLKSSKIEKKNCRVFLEIFALIYASQVSSELRLLRGGSHRGRCFHSQSEQ